MIEDVRVVPVAYMKILEELAKKAEIAMNSSGDHGIAALSQQIGKLQGYKMAGGLTEVERSDR